MNTYTVSLTFGDMEGDSPQEALQSLLGWLNKDGNVVTCVYNVTNEKTGEVTVIDLEGNPMTYTVVAVYQNNGQVYVTHVEAPDTQSAVERAKRSAEAPICVLSVFLGGHQDIYGEEELMEVW